MATADVSIQPVIAPNRALLGQQPRPGETWGQFLERTQLHTKVDRQGLAEAEDAFKVAQLSQANEAKSRSILDEQSGLQKTRLNELVSLLAKQQGDQFKMDIPQIAETAQGQGFLETSGFGNALANRYKELTAGTSAEIAKQALSDRDLQIKGIGDIGRGATDLATAGVERQFSTEDLTRSEELARELAKYGVAAPTKVSSFDQNLGRLGQIAQIGATVAGAKGGK